MTPTTLPGHPWPVWRARIQSMLRACVDPEHALLPAAIASLLAFLATAFYVAGGPEPLAQLLYLPVLLAAARYGPGGGMASAAAASALLLPWFLLDAGSSGGVEMWLLHLAIMMALGAGTGVVAATYRRSLGRLDARARHVARTCERLLGGLASIVESRDDAARGHGSRVARNAVALGRDLALSSEDLETLYWGAMLHDLGKIAVPESILLKPGPLTEDELDLVRQHPDVGADLLLSLGDEFTPVAEVVRHHHERYDGLGYPGQLEGHAIPPLARIVTVLDVFEALTTKRPYRKPMSAAGALAFLELEAGRHFDPDVVVSLKRLYDRGLIEVPEDAAGVESEGTHPDSPEFRPAEYRVS